MSNPNTAAFPSAVATYSNLPLANDTYYTTLSGNINSSQTTGISLGAVIPNLPAIIVIDSEIILVATMSGTTITGSTRGFASSTAASHLSGADVFGYIVSYHHNQILAEIVAIENALGVSLANVIKTSATAGGDLSGNYPNPNVNTVGGASSGSIALAASLAHHQNTDIGTSVNTVTFSTSPNFNLALGGIQTITLTNNVVSSTVTNLVKGSWVTFIIHQDSTGGRSFTWPGVVHGGASTISSMTASQIFTQEFKSDDGSNLYATSSGIIMS